MPLPKGVDLLPDEVRAMLPAGETPLSWELASSFAQASQVGGTPKADVGFSMDPVAGGITVNQDWLDGKLTGFSAGGEVGQLGHRFEQALAGTGNCNILLTDTRLGVIDQRSGPKLTSAYVPAFGVELGAVSDIALDPRGLMQRGRVRISFADGSWATAMMGVFKTSAARRLIDAFHSATTRRARP